MSAIAIGQKKIFNQFGNAGLLLSGKLAPEGKRLFAQMQVNPLDAHAHKLTIVGLYFNVIFEGSAPQMRHICRKPA
jgi:hypothetical protein